MLASDDEPADVCEVTMSAPKKRVNETSTTFSPTKKQKKKDTGAKILSAIEKLNKDETPTALKCFFDSMCARAECWSLRQQSLLQMKMTNYFHEVEFEISLDDISF